MTFPTDKVPAVTPVGHAYQKLQSRPFVVSRQMLANFAAAYDIIAIVVSGLLARYIYLTAYRNLETPILEYLSLILVTSIFFQLVARQKRLYDPAKVEDLLSQLHTLMHVCAGTFAITFAAYGSSIG